MARLKAHPALLIIDMQNGFCHETGSFGKLGLPVSRHKAIVPAINRLRALCGARGIPVFYTRFEADDTYFGAGPLAEEYAPLKELGAFLPGSWDAEVLDELRPGADDTVVVKARNSAFFGPELGALLQARGINQVLATGVGTNVCVETTVRDAVAHNYHTLTVSDATATLSDEEQAASMLNLQHFGGSASVDELEKELLDRAEAPIRP